MAADEPVPFPARPMITAVFAAAIAFWAACASAYATGDVRDMASSQALAVCALLGVVAAVPLAVWKKARLAGILLMAGLAGVALGSGQAASLHAQSGMFEGAAGARVELKVLEDSRDFGFGEIALVETRLQDAEPAVFSARFASAEPLLTGEHVIADVSFAPNDFERDSYAWSDGACGQLKATAREPASSPFPVSALIEFRKRAIEGIGAEDDEHALLQALVCGYRRNVSGTEMYSQFQTCGLAHLVAVSGAHLVIVTGLAAAALERACAPRRLTISVLIAVMASYFVIAGMPVSALRAMAMSSLGLASYFGRRRASSVNAIGITIIAIVSLSPTASISPSFVLSTLSTTGIVLFAPLVQAWIERTPFGRLSFVSDALSLTVSASLLSQLYACSLFHQLPLVSPLANIVVAPLFPIACGAGLALGVARAAFSFVTPLSFVPDVISSALTAIIGMLASIPYASVPFAIDTPIALVLSAFCALALWMMWPRPNWKSFAAFSASAIAVVVALSLLGGREDAIVALDVGQGDAILIESRGQRWLIDTGNQDSKLLEQLALNHVAHLDGVIVSHADDDHCGSIDALEKAVQVDRFVLAQGMLDCRDAAACELVDEAGECADDVVGVGFGDSFAMGAFAAHVVWPHEFKEGGGNADSLCLLIDYDGNDDGEVDFNALFTGDAEHEELASMLGESAISDIDVLKVGHHGSRNGSTLEQMAALDPEVAIISCGANNRYGHPTQEILDQLSEVGSRTFRTDRDGAIKCIFSPDGILVTCG